MKLFYYLSCCFGSSNLGYISRELLLEQRDFEDCPQSKISAYFALFEIKDLGSVIESQKNSPYLLNFVTDIFDIVYRTSDRFFAGANYIGDNKFFIIWKLKKNNRVNNFQSKKVNRNSSEMASLSVTALLKLFIKLDKLRFKTLKTEKEEFNDYITTVLHAGTLNEILIGSKLKLDVAFSGEDISKTHLLHDYALDRHSAFLVSDRVYNIIPECMKFECRLVDVVKFSVFDKPIDLYCMDITNRILRKDMRMEDFKEKYECCEVYQKRKIHCSIKYMIKEKLQKGAKNSMFWKILS